MKISKISSTKTVITRILEFLNTLPDDEVVSTRELEEHLSLSTNSGDVRRNWYKLANNVETASIDGCRTRVWGNKKAISALRKQFNEN